MKKTGGRKSRDTLPLKEQFYAKLTQYATLFSLQSKNPGENHASCFILPDLTFFRLSILIFPYLLPTLKKLGAQVSLIDEKKIKSFVTGLL